MRIVKPIDPAKIAKLDNVEFNILMLAADMLNERMPEAQIPLNVYAPAFCIMKKCGATDLRNHHGMWMIANQINHSRLLIDRLRSHDALSSTKTGVGVVAARNTWR